MNMTTKGAHPQAGFLTRLVRVILRVVRMLIPFPGRYHLFHQIQFTVNMIRTKRDIRNVTGSPSYTAVDLFEGRVRESANVPAIVELSEGNRVWTYGQLDELANKIAHVFHAAGVEQGEVVGLLMNNSAEFIATWVGLAKIGASTAFINTSCTGKSLFDAIGVAGAKRVILGSDFHHVMDNVPQELQATMWYVLSPGGPLGVTALGDDINGASGKRVDPALRNKSTSSDVLMYIFTSGTTGLPKAAKIRHMRFVSSGFASKYMVGQKPGDKIYCTLPMCHGSATYFCCAGAWVCGSTVFLRKKFSASTFFKDCTEHRCTVMLYIGELCTFLTLSPPSPYDRTHNLRLAAGNGMRADVWRELVRRFNIPNVTEGYGSTEGNVSLFNAMNKIGSVGYVPPITKIIYPLVIVKFDHDAEVPVRDKAGHCIPCDFNEAGEAICKILNDPFTRFDGYNNKAATDKKILRNVFKDGDQYFRSGDLLREDDEGFIYFVDRVGDTFRWKGENVATTEVAQVLERTNLLAAPANVYGVKVGDREGRCGMAAICIEKGHSVSDVLGGLYTEVMKELSHAQRPYFIRIVPAELISITGTIKLKKADLVAQGFDPETVPDPVYVLSQKDKGYTRLTTDLMPAVMDPQSRMV